MIAQNTNDPMMSWPVYCVIVLQLISLATDPHLSIEIFSSRIIALQSNKFAQNLIIQVQYSLLYLHQPKSEPAILAHWHSATISST